ncbi:protein LKAAEAR1-like [Dendronephthya gigantea]|uniref:protein LKAAEAR1-like n=1 Tax=Dendronephthya gigantea TaxID=151771 RepID=UPI0010690BB0|nr:protein LKAAEAR1-like [Dendronephthya gigantea]
MSTVKLPEINSDEGFQARNWKQLSKREVLNLDPVQRSRYMAYESLSKETAQSMCEARKRIHDRRKNEIKHGKGRDKRDPDRENHARLIGQLKAAEARNRIRLMRLRYTGNKASEMNNLIACQPSAIKAVRLQCLVPPHPEKIIIRDLLGKDERSRVDVLLEDELNLTTNRLLS